MRFAAIALVALLLASCAGGAGTDYCYKTVRSPTSKGPRALVATACPADRQAMSISAQDAGYATAG